MTAIAPLCIKNTMIKITSVEYIVDFTKYAFPLRVSVYVSYIVPFTGIQEIAPLVSCTFVFSISYFESELSAESSKEFRKRLERDITCLWLRDLMSYNQIALL